MSFDTGNPIIKLCAKGMELEASHGYEEARQLYLQAWNESANDFEKFIAAHYMARHQPSAEEKLSWDKTALTHALKAGDENMTAHYPSLYLNIAKCYEELKDADNARKNYESALAYLDKLPNDGYGRMIRLGIQKGLERLAHAIPAIDDENSN